MRKVGKKGARLDVLLIVMTSSIFGTVASQKFAGRKGTALFSLLPHPDYATAFCFFSFKYQIIVSSI